jgi:hypothetical protein
MNSFLLIGLAPETEDDSAPNVPAGTTADPFSVILAGVQKQFADQGDHLDLCKLQLDGPAEVPVTARLAHATYDCILLGGGLREPGNLELFERVINSVHRHAPGAAIGLVNLPQDALEAADRVLSQDYEQAGLLSSSASLT